MTSPTILILGAGANVGVGVAKQFSSKGFKVAAASRTIKPEVQTSADLALQADFSDPSSIPSLFSNVNAKLGIPNVVVYNAGSVGSMNLTGPPGDLTSSLAVNAVSLYAALQEAVRGFETLPKDVRKTFIYTGNFLNLVPSPALAMLGTGKAAGAHLIQVADKAYSDLGYKFYYADQRKAGGDAVYGAISGKAHGEFFWELTQEDKESTNIPWLATFVDGKGYVDFGRK